MAENPQKKTQPADAPASGLFGLSAEQLDGLIGKLGDAIGAGIVKAQSAEREANRPGARKPLPKREVPEEFKGPRTYIVGKGGAYQHNRRFVQGERITVVDQFPAKDWTPVESLVETPAKAPAVKTGRASDQNVG